MNTRLFLLAFAFCSLSCKTKSLDGKYNSVTVNDDLRSLSEKKLINDSDQILLMSYIFSKNGDTAALNKPYKILLDYAKAEDFSKKQREAKNKEVNSMLDVHLVSKTVEQEFRDGVWKNILVLSAVFKNQSSKTINAVSFALLIYSIDNKFLGNYNWTLSFTVAKNASKTMKFSLGSMENANNLVERIKVTNLSKLRVEYKIKQLIFTDGTSVDTY